jgi:hypothetical protein
MSWLRYFRRRRADGELQQEIDFYLTEEIAENLAGGKSPQEARRQHRSGSDLARFPTGSVESNGRPSVFGRAMRISGCIR